MEQKLIKKFRWSTIVWGILSLFMVLGAVVVVVVYMVPRTTPLLETFVERMPLPVVMTGYRSVISFRELAANVSSVKQFYESQDFSKIGMRVDFSTEDGKKRLKVREKEVLNKMLEDQSIVLLARKRGIFVSQEMAHQGVARKLEEYGSATQVKDNLKRLYGWDLAVFEERVVLPSLYEDKLKESFFKEVNPVTEAKQKIELAAEALRNGGTFSDVTKKYSDGQTAESGGDLGWLTLEDLTPELRTSVASQKVGVPGNVIESNLGFHIVFVDEVKNEQNGPLYRLRQIFARKETFSDWLTQEMKTLPIWVFSSEYRYDQDTARIEFKDATWKQYEEDLYNKASGDPSFLF